MNSVTEELEFFKQLMVALKIQLGPRSEIVLHDLLRPLDSTIVAIENGHISGREVGGPCTDMGLTILNNAEDLGNYQDYVSRTKSGKLLNSSSAFIFNNERIIGSLCINTDVTSRLMLEQHLLNGTPQSYPDFEQKGKKNKFEFLGQNVSDILDHLFVDAEKAVGVPTLEMTKEQKIEFLGYIDTRGAFLIAKCGEKACEYLGVSKFTLYKYLDIARRQNGISEA